MPLPRSVYERQEERRGDYATFWLCLQSSCASGPKGKTKFTQMLPNEIFATRLAKRAVQMSKQKTEREIVSLRFTWPTY